MGEYADEAQRAEVEALVEQIFDVSQTITKHQEIYGKPCYVTVDLSRSEGRVRRMRENYRLARSLGIGRRASLSLALKVELKRGQDG